MVSLGENAGRGKRAAGRDDETDWHGEDSFGLPADSACNCATTPLHRREGMKIELHADPYV